MKIGLTYDLKDSIVLGQYCPDDALEEYDSPETIDAISQVFLNEGHQVLKLGGGREFLKNILENNVDIIFNISEGRGNFRSREAQVPSVLEMLEIPYIGSDPLCLAMCLDKPLTKKIILLEGITTPYWIIINNIEDLYKTDWSDFPFPAFTKPAHEGSSKGIRLSSIIKDKKHLFSSLPSLLDSYQQPVMVEEFIDGDEITVGLIGNHPPKVLGIMRILAKTNTGHFVYSLEVKRDWQNLVDYECPAQLKTDTLEKIEKFSLKIFKALGCRDFARLDFKVSKDGIPYFLEANPLAGLNPKSSDLPIMSYKLGIEYKQLILDIFNSAIARYPKCVMK